ncbi:hypothetical protein ABFA07_007602 [Porites harrisoni]
MKNYAVLLLCLSTFFLLRNSQGRPRGKLRLKRQTTQSSSSALGALMSFSVKLSDMERQIASYEKTIKRQTAEIDQLRAKLDSKSERSQFQSLQALLTSKMTTVKDEINTKDLVIERYRNKLRQLEEEITEIRDDYAQLHADSTQVLDKFDNFGLHCTTQKTGYAPKVNGAIGYLDRQWVRCHQNEFLQAFVLKMATSYGEDMVRYEYQCCSLSI